VLPGKDARVLLAGKRTSATRSVFPLLTLAV
jgi:hypothetical protein